MVLRGLNTALIKPVISTPGNCYLQHQGSANVVFTSSSTHNLWVLFVSKIAVQLFRKGLWPSGRKELFIVPFKI